MKDWYFHFSVCLQHDSHFLCSALCLAGETGKGRGLSPAPQELPVQSQVKRCVKVSDRADSVSLAQWVAPVRERPGSRAGLRAQAGPWQELLLLQVSPASCRALTQSPQELSPQQHAPGSTAHGVLCAGGAPSPQRLRCKRSLWSCVTQ